jgi:hypothetical protein
LSLSPVKALSILSTLRSADIILPTTDGREIRLRRVTTPTSDQQQLLDPGRTTLSSQFVRVSSWPLGITSGGEARRHCWDYEVLDLDVRGFFDNIDWELMMKAVKKHAQEPAYQRTGLT